jgi:hypothetical protein
VAGCRCRVWVVAGHAGRARGLDRGTHG